MRAKASRMLSGSKFWFFFLRSQSHSLFPISRARNRAKAVSRFVFTSFSLSFSFPHFQSECVPNAIGIEVLIFFLRSHSLFHISRARNRAKAKFRDSGFFLRSHSHFHIQSERVPNAFGIEVLIFSFGEASRFVVSNRHLASSSSFQNLNSKVPGCRLFFCA